MNLCSPGFVAAVTAGYFALVPVLFGIVNVGVPMWIEHILLLIASPGVFAILPWIPLLRRLGLAEGEWLVGPSVPAYVVLSLLYVVVAALGALLLCRWLSR